MNDITALAQRMKAAASEITKDTWQLNADEEVVHIDSEGYENFIACTAITDIAQFISIASPANVLALVEALESGDTENERMARDLISRNGEIEGLRKRVEELEEVATDYGMKFQRAQDDLKKMALIHRDESRTVTVKLPDRYSCELGYNSPNPNGDMLDRDDVLAMLAAAGIQVIEGEGQ